MSRRKEEGVSAFAFMQGFSSVAQYNDRRAPEEQVCETRRRRCHNGGLGVTDGVHNGRLYGPLTAPPQRVSDVCSPLDARRAAWEEEMRGRDLAKAYREAGVRIRSAS